MDHPALGDDLTVIFVLLRALLPLSFVAVTLVCRDSGMS